MTDRNTLADFLAELGVDIANMQEFLNKLSMMLTTSSDSVSINQSLQDGTNKTFVVPSFAYLTNKVNAVDNKFNSLLTGNANRIGVVDENGQVKTFELQDVSNVIADLDSISSKSVPTPISFNYKNNWFFESFLNPLLYINVSVDGIVTSDIDRFEITRVIITTTSQADLDHFDSTYKGKNNLKYSTVIRDLKNRAISYFEDTNETAVPPSQNKISGSFDILSLLSDTESKLVFGESQNITVTKYVLNTLRYMEKATTSPNGVVQRTLKPGDILITQDNSEYSINSVNSKENSVTLQRIFGIGDLTAGASKLQIKPQLDLIKTVPINIGYNERQIIFLRPFSSRLKVTTQNYSLGFGIYSSDLTIALTTGEVMTLRQFYNKFVSDFSLLFLNYSKDKKVPTVLGEKPNAVVLSADHFKVIQIDAHIQIANNIQEVKQNIASVESIKSQIVEIDRQISEKRAQLNTNAALTNSQQLKLNKDLKTLSDSRAVLSTAQASKISSITTAVKGTPGLIKAPTYHVKGMWHIPEPIDTINGLQNVAQFKIAYRVLSSTGTSETVEQITYTDPKGSKIVGSFSPWKEILGKPRTKRFNTTTGFYEWASEDVANPDVVNCNQVELLINKGETLEIRVKSLSEAGWPDNPVESDWSNSILVEFPADMQTIEDISIIAQQAFAEETKIKFQQDLDSKGLDLHLSTSFTSRDKYFSHRAEDIASGFFATDGSIVDLYAKIKQISDTLSAIQTSLASGTGVLKVSIIDQVGNTISVNNGQTIQIFAGYYKDLIQKTSGSITTYEHGKIITSQYYIQLENTSQSPLQLIAAMNGGTGEKVNASVQNGPTGYDTNLRYDICPISLSTSTVGKIGGFKHSEGYQSAQAKGQIINSRLKSLNLSEELVCGDNQSSTYLYDPLFDINNYQYDGVTLTETATKVPYASGHYLPYNPKLGSLTIKVNNVNYSMSANPSVWNGTLDGSAPVGGGLLSEFCISTDHPDIKSGGKYNVEWSASLYLPEIGVTGTDQAYLPFSQAIHVETSESDLVNPFNVNFCSQAAYKTPAVKLLKDSPYYEYYYPVKLGFLANDQYLIGKYTCGAYLYISPTSHEEIAATAYSPTVSKRVVEVGESNAIKIPLIFQYRCSDYLSYVGGFRANATSGLRNVRYTKHVGFDIQLKDDNFSFDVLVSAQYEKETAVLTPIGQISSVNQMSQIAITATD